MKFVSLAANEMVKECVQQLPKIMGPEKVTSDCERRIRISTEASLREMLDPGALAILSPPVGMRSIAPSAPQAVTCGSQAAPSRAASCS